MGELEEKLADYGIDQFVRNVVVKVLTKYVGKPEKMDEVIDEINRQLMIEFKEKAGIAAKKVFAQMKELVEKQ